MVHAGADVADPFRTTTMRMACSIRVKSGRRNAVIMAVLPLIHKRAIENEDDQPAIIIFPSHWYLADGQADLLGSLPMEAAALAEAELIMDFLRWVRI
jgi:hypothetical protein